VAAMLWMTILAVRLDVLLSYWTNGLFTAMQDFNAAAFRYFLVVFGMLTAAYFVHSRIEYLIEQTFIIQWRGWLNDHIVADWLDGRVYHRGHFVSTPVDNPNQRIQEDTTAFVVESLGLTLGAVRSVVALVSFMPILWGLSGELSGVRAYNPRSNGFSGLFLCDCGLARRLPDRSPTHPAQLHQ
jgi:vitamin B12/bleomycin/antimicrobial peptide transport system ATP-binding/permease protein